MDVKLPITCMYCFLAIVCSGQLISYKPKIQVYRKPDIHLPDSSLQKLYNDLGKSFLSPSAKHKSSIDSAFFFLRKAVYIKDSSNIDNNVLTNESICLLAEAYLASGDLSQAKKLFGQIINNYRRSGNKTKEAETWNRQAVKLVDTNTDSVYVQSCFDHSLQLYKETENIFKKIEVVLNMASFHTRRGNAALACKEVINLLKESKENGAYKLSDLFLFLASVNRYKGNYMEGLTYALNAVKYYENHGDSSNAHNIYGELALQYQELNQPEKSIYWYKKCIEARVKRNIKKYAIYRTVYLMIVQMIKVNEEKEALKILQNMARTNPPDSPTENAVLSQSMAYCFDALGEYALAEKYFLAMIKEYSEEEENSEVMFIANFDVGKFFLDHKQYSKAEPYLNEAFTTRTSTTISRVKDIHLLLFTIDSAKGNYTSAIGHFQQYKSLNDSIFTLAKSKQIEELMIAYETDKKEKNIIILQKENMLQQKSLKQASSTRNFILTGIALLLLIVGLLYNRYWFKQKTNRHLQGKQKEIEKQNLSLQHLVQEKEWLLKEIHHRVKNNLHTIIGLLDTQSGYLKTEEALLAISDSQHRVQAMSLIHQKLFQSEDLSTIQLPGYIYELVDYLKHAFDTGQRIQFKMDIDHLVVSLSYSLPIGLILNEAITNSIKYAFPGNSTGLIAISLKQVNAQQYLLTIVDNGKGLPQGFDHRQSSTMGISLMQGLSEDIEGSFSIINNAGTEIQIHFLYDPVHDDHFVQPSFT